MSKNYNHIELLRYHQNQKITYNVVYDYLMLYIITEHDHGIWHNNINNKYYLPIMIA